jgi:tRNA modification GTPase
MDTIFAVSSGAPPAAIAVVRISGRGAFETVARIAGTLPAPRHAALRALRDPADGALLDRALVLLFPGPASATGEDLAELHLHGGRAVVRRVERMLGDQPGLRPAEPGEFTRRALASGRIDLTEAEGLGDLLMAETEQQRRAAIRAVEGSVRREVTGWAMRVLALAADVEAMLDHSDEEDVQGVSLADVQADSAALADEIAALCARPPVERLRDGIRVVLAGPPNAGKSTLLNALAGRDAAIVSPIAGTTRDRIEVPVVRDGVAYLLLDTAGLADASADPIERIGIARAEEAIAAGDILLWLGDAAPAMTDAATLAVHARADLAARSIVPEGRIAISAATGQGLDRLWSEVDALARTLLPPCDTIALNRRQRDLCIAAAAALQHAANEADPLLIAENLRAARRQFDRITGAADVEAMLDSLFARFCIGK